MADEDQTEQDGKAKSGGKLKWIIIIIVIIILVAGLSIFATWFLLKDKLSEPPVDDIEEIPLEEQVMSVEQGEAIYHALQPAFVINYNAEGKVRFLQTELTVLTRDPESIEILVLHDPLIRNNLLDVFAEQDVMQLYTEAGKQALADELTKAIADILTSEMGRPAIEAILYRSFIMQ